MKRGELVSMFPDAEVWEEKFLGLTKSLIVYRMGNRETSWENRVRAALATAELEPKPSRASLRAQS